MPAPAFIAIADAVVAALKTANVARGRVFHIIPDEAALSASAVSVGIEATDPEAAEIGNAPLDWNTTLRLDMYVRFGAKDARRHNDVTQLYGDAYAALMSDQTLGGLALYIEPGPATWNYADEDLQSGVVSAQFFILHRTEPLSLSATAL